MMSFDVWVCDNCGSAFEFDDFYESICSHCGCYKEALKND